MSAEEALHEAYREWRRLARAEHTAIQKRDWGFLLKCQHAVRVIQSSIPRLQQEADLERGHSHPGSTTKQKDLHSTVSELIETVKSNKKLLESARLLALAEREKLVQAARNLKRLQNSYEMTRRSRWSSFS